MIKKEAKFYKIIKNTCSVFGAFYYKIPDAYGFKPADGSRFLLSKPYDLIFVYNGFTFHTEVKYLSEIKAFSVKNLRESQIKALTEISKNQSVYTTPLVVLGIYKPRKMKRMYFFHYDWLVKNPMRKKDLMAIDKYIDIKSRILPDGKRKDMFNIDTIFGVIKEL